MNPRTWREHKELTLAAMGQLVGVSAPAVQRYENAERFPTPDTIEAYRVSTNGAVTYEDFVALRREKTRPAKAPARRAKQRARGAA